MEEPPESRFEAVWWRCLYTLVAVGVASLGIGSWLSRPPAPWTRGWTGWWTGDRSDHGPLERYQPPFLSSAAEIAHADDAALIRLPATSNAQLGHLSPRQPSLTLSTWVRCGLPGGSWPVGFLAVMSAENDFSRLQLGFEQGFPELRLETRQPSGDWRTLERLRAEHPEAAGTWVHLSGSVDEILCRLAVHGRTAGEGGTAGTGLDSALLTVSCLVFDSGGRPATAPPGLLVEHDELVVFDRIVPLHELSQLADGPRGCWEREIGRPALARRFRTAAASTVGVAALLLAIGRWFRKWSGGKRALKQIGWQREYRSARWILVLGLTGSLLAGAAVEIQGRLLDLDRFGEILRRFGVESDGYWEDLESLLKRARDWVQENPDADLEAWTRMLDDNRYPRDYGEVVGIGYARQVQPGRLIEHEQAVSGVLGFPYHVTPPLTAPRALAWRLDGQPLLPVVFYTPNSLPRHRWMTNDTILGRDLLYQDPGDARMWSQARRIEEALLEGETRSSSLEEIAPSPWFGNPIEGLRLYVPLVDHPRVLLEPPVRSSTWEGVAFASVDLRGLALARLNASRPTIGFRLIAGENPGSRHDTLVDTGELLPASRQRPSQGPPYRTEIKFFNSSLFLEVWTTESFDRQSIRRWAIPVGGTGAGLSVMMASLLFFQIRARDRQLQMAVQLRETNDRLRVEQHERERLSRERERLSRDLHDGTIQNLYAIGLHLLHAERQLPSGADKDASRGLLEGQRLIQETIVELRNFLIALKDEMPAVRTFRESLDGFLVHLGRASQVRFTLEVDPATDGIPPVVTTELVILVREAVSNALRHGSPTQVWILLRGDGTHWDLSVRDDGCGFDPDAVSTDGNGLKTMLGRAREIGATMRLDSTPGSGTLLSIEWRSPNMARKGPHAAP